MKASPNCVKLQAPLMTCSLDTLNSRNSPAAAAPGGFKRVAREVGLILGLVGLILWMAALLSYSPQDAAWSTSGNPDAASGTEPDGYVWRPGAARTLLLAADETAVPAVAVILEGLPADATGHVFLEVPTAADALPLAAPAGVQVTWLPREEQPFGGALVPAVTAWVDAWAAECAQPAPVAIAAEEPESAEYEILWDVPEQPASDDLYAWLAGEAGAITGLRRHLVRERGVDRKQVAFMGYWKLGRAEN